MSQKLKKENGAQEEHLDVADYIDKFAVWTEAHAKKIMMVFGAFTLAVVAFWAVSMMQEKALNVAAHDTGVVNRKIELLEKAIADSKDKESAEFKANKESEILKIHKEAMGVVSKYSDRAVADFTITKWASFLIAEKKEDMALEILSESKPDGSRELSVTTLFLKASMASKKGDRTAAIESYDQVLKEPKWALFHGEALIQKASLLQAGGKIDEAILLFDQAKNMNKESSVSKEAAKYKRLLQLKKNHPEIFKTEG